jgi:hypothetical protein
MTERQKTEHQLWLVECACWQWNMAMDASHQKDLIGMWYHKEMALVLENALNDYGERVYENYTGRKPTQHRRRG